MTKMNAVLMHGTRGGEGRYTFELAEPFDKATPVRVMRAFMADIEKATSLGHIDYEINAALKNRDAKVVTVIGDLIFDGDNRQPFMCMISPA